MIFIYRSTKEQDNCKRVTVVAHNPIVATRIIFKYFERVKAVGQPKLITYFN